MKCSLIKVLNLSILFEDLLEVCESVESANDYDEFRETRQKVKKARTKEPVRNQQDVHEKSDNIYEDIYGRIRNKNGPVLQKTVKESVGFLFGYICLNNRQNWKKSTKKFKN